MLYLLGAVALDTKGLSADAFERSGNGGLITKPTMGGRQAKERTGEGDSTITITGSTLPSRGNGMMAVEMLEAMRRTDMRFPVMRGDGYCFGWYAIRTLRETHEEIEENGVGFVVSVSVTLEQADPSIGGGQQVVAGLLSLFGAAGGI